MAKVNESLPGDVDLSGYPAMFSGSGERFADFMTQVRQDEHIASAAALNPTAAANRITTIASLERVKDLICPRCRKATVYVEGGGCAGCDGEEATIFVAPEQVECSLCEGRGAVDVVPDEMMVEKPLVPGSDDDS